jgi:hypothetical protein
MAFPSYNSGQQAFIPEIFSKLLQAKFYKQSVLPAISNNDYEGEISGQGDKVHIRTVPAVTINNYTGTITNQDLTSSTIELLIDQAKYYSFKVDDILAKQADVNMLEAASSDAAEGMRVAVEEAVLAAVAPGANTVETSTTTITASNILERILIAGKALDIENIPEEGRFIVLSPEFIMLLKQSELRQAYLTGDGTSPLRNGKVGMIDRFTVYQSNMLPVDTDGETVGATNILAGHPKAISFASQFTAAETVRLETTFGDAVRGLKVYGSKVVVPKALYTCKWT